MKLLINLFVVACYVTVCYLTVNFTVSAIGKIDGVLGFSQFILTAIIIVIVTGLAGYFCVKILTTKDTM